MPRPTSDLLTQQDARQYDAYPMTLWVWNTSPGACATCSALDGRRFLYDGVPKRPHPNCKCTVSVDPSSVPEDKLLLRKGGLADQAPGAKTLEELWETANIAELAKQMEQREAQDEPGAATGTAAGDMAASSIQTAAAIADYALSTIDDNSTEYGRRHGDQLCNEFVCNTIGNATGTPLPDPTPGDGYPYPNVRHLDDSEYAAERFVDVPVEHIQAGDMLTWYDRPFFCDYMPCGPLGDHHSAIAVSETHVAYAGPEGEVVKTIEFVNDKLKREPTNVRRHK